MTAGSKGDNLTAYITNGDPTVGLEFFVQFSRLKFLTSKKINSLFPKSRTQEIEIILETAKA